VDDLDVIAGAVTICTFPLSTVWATRELKVKTPLAAEKAPIKPLSNRKPDFPSTSDSSIKQDVEIGLGD